MRRGSGRAEGRGWKQTRIQSPTDASRRVKYVNASQILTRSACMPISNSNVGRL